MPRYWPFTKYPGTDYETFNWDWLIRTVKDYTAKVDDFTEDMTNAWNTFRNYINHEIAEMHRKFAIYVNVTEEALNTGAIADGAITEPKIDGDFLKSIHNRYVTLEMYGGAGDGSTDDSAALASATASGYPVCLLPDKTYRINSTVNLTTSAVIFGCGELSELLIDRDGSVNTDANTDHTLELCEFKCTVRKVHGNGINITKTNDANAKNCISIHDMVFYMDNDIDTNLDSIMVYLKGVREASITNCVFKGDSSSYGTGLYMTADSTHLTMNIAISECNFYYLKKCIDLDNTAANLVYLAGIRMVDNMFIGAEYGLHAKFIDTFFMMNSMFDFCINPIVSDGSLGVKIDNNYIQTNSDACIRIINTRSAACRFGEITNNYLWSTANGLVTDAISMEGVAEKIAFWRITNNTSTHTRAMINMKNCQNCMINDNICHESTTFFDGNNDSTIITIKNNKADASVQKFMINNHGSNSVRYGNSLGLKYSENCGVTTITGDGTTDYKDVSHDLFGRSYYKAACGSSGPYNIAVLTPDDEHIRITVNPTPPAGTVIELNWEAAIAGS